MNKINTTNKINELLKYMWSAEWFVLFIHVQRVLAFLPKSTLFEFPSTERPYARTILQMKHFMQRRVEGAKSCSTLSVLIYFHVLLIVLRTFTNTSGKSCVKINIILIYNKRNIICNYCSWKFIIVNYFYVNSMCI